MTTPQGGPNRPEPQPLTLTARETAIAALDLSKHALDPQRASFHLLQPVGEFLNRARAARVPVVYTVSLVDKGTPMGEVAPPLKRRESEAIIYPDGFDKFTGGELHQLLTKWGTKNLVVVGAATNFAVLYTVTAAARVYHYHTVVPLDGVAARNQYEHEYAIHQMTVLPPNVITPIRFSKLSMINFA